MHTRHQAAGVHLVHSTCAGGDSLGFDGLLTVDHAGCQHDDPAEHHLCRNVQCGIAGRLRVASRAPQMVRV